MTNLDHLQKLFAIAKAENEKESLALASAMQSDSFDKVLNALGKLDGSIKNLDGALKRLSLSSWAMVVLSIAIAALTCVLVYRSF